MFSLVAKVPFSPIDLDLGLLARGVWDSSNDRFRIWFLTKEQAGSERPTCYVMIRKFDPDQGVITVVHIVANLDAALEGPECYFTVGILSNDEVRARSTLGAMLGIPPSFHKRSEITVVEKKWRSDPETVARYSANVQSATAAKTGPNGEGPVFKLELPADFMAKIGLDLDRWWSDERGHSEEPQH